MSGLTHGTRRGEHCATCWTAFDGCIQPEAKKEQTWRLLAIKGNSLKVRQRSNTLLGDDCKSLKSQRTSTKEREKVGPSLPRDKSRELLMQHDLVGLALKIPLGRTGAAISICLITRKLLFLLRTTTQVRKQHLEANLSMTDTILNI